MKHLRDICMSVCVATGIPAVALAAPHFVERQIVVQGNQDFEVTGINDSGTMVGTLYAPITAAPSGVVVTQQSVTTIPAPYSIGGPAQPTSIYNDGTIIGSVQTFVGGHQMFVSRAGVIDPNYEIALDYGSSFGVLGVNTLGLVGSKVFFTRVISRTLPNVPEYGTPPNFHTVAPIKQFNTIKGLSKTGMVSGTAFNEMGPKVIFLGKGKTFRSIAPPGAISASGGFSNVAGKLAGSYSDAMNVAHGFVYAAGRYTSFDMPVLTYDVEISAINDKGWVVGTYTSDANNVQHAFFYDGASVVSIGNYDATTNLSVALNNVGQVVISERVFDSTPKYLSFLETCRPGSC